MYADIVGQTNPAAHAMLQLHRPATVFFSPRMQATFGLSGFVAGFTIPEQAIADVLVAEGDTVVPLEVVPGAKSPDASVNGVKTEFKTLEGTGPNSLKNQIEKGLGQGQNVVVDARNVSSVTKQYATQQIQRVEGKVGSLQGRVTILTQEGPVKH